MKISVTGKFASGKSSFCRYFSKEKLRILSGDEIGKEILEENKKEILSMLRISSSENYLEKMKSLFLEDETKFIKYNNWMYLHLPEEIITRCSKYDDVILDAALVFEWQIDEFFDINILVSDGTFEERFIRAKKQRPNADEPLYRMLDKYQWSDDKKRIYVDLVVENKGTLKELEIKSDEAFKKIFSAR
ncbi:MAG: dephospho-CoA kinase [bacterium]|nr:dephospho-CoA kinase [bacterium]